MNYLCLLTEKFVKLRIILKYENKKIPHHIHDEGFKEGGDLLFHDCSIIGANGLNFSVRNGKR